jgi:hypothetical protein
MTNEKNYQAKLMPLKRVVCIITNEAALGDEQGIRKAVKAWHNKLANGSVPRSMFRKIGKHLFVDLAEFQDWLKNQ